MSRTAGPKVRGTAASLVLVGLLAAATACGPSRGPRVGGSSTQIIRSEILSVPDRSAYSLVRILRPRWLEARVKATPNNPTPVYAHVYVDNLAYGPLESLFDISSNVIDRIDYLGALDATTRFGSGFMGGIIHVHTRVGR